MGNRGFNHWSNTPEYAQKVLLRIFSSCQIVGQCNVWQKYLNRNGYPYIYAFGRMMPVHKAIMIINGKISLNSKDPFENVVDHTCRNRACCNPMHLRVVTSQTNVIENSTSRGALNKSKTHCPSGHEYNKENTVIKKHKLASGSFSEWRRCKECNKRQTRKWKINQKKYLENRDEK